jgi:hypothetical protein
VYTRILAEAKFDFSAPGLDQAAPDGPRSQLLAPRQATSRREGRRTGRVTMPVPPDQLRQLVSLSLGKRDDGHAADIIALGQPRGLRERGVVGRRTRRLGGSDQLGQAGVRVLPRLWKFGHITWRPAPALIMRQEPTHRRVRAQIRLNGAKESQHAPV